VPLSGKAPWVIKSHNDNKIISSHKTKEEAESHLRDIQMHKHASFSIDTIFVDMDGVLVDFDKQIYRYFHTNSKTLFAQYGDDYVWSKIDLIPGFWKTMDWNKEGYQLWTYLKSIKGINIYFLTTPANSVRDCKSDKLEWVYNHIGPEWADRVIFSENKGDYANANSLLIDDMEKNINSFQDAGGQTILFDDGSLAVKQLKQIFNINKFANFSKETDEILGQGKWITLKKSESGWEYITQRPGVILLPIRGVDTSNIEILLRKDVNPIHGETLTLITGRIDEGEEPILTAMRELKEEAGVINQNIDNFKEVCDIYYGKCIATPDKLFFVIVEDAIYEKPITDGSTFESLATNLWMNMNEIKSLVTTSTDPIFLQAISKFLIIWNELDR
jgi:8-oxo-dGTP pyrophosphatase MutT (NUDIX family)/5'(3')-deoxyribonucleotidase